MLVGELCDWKCQNGWDMNGEEGERAAKLDTLAGSVYTEQRTYYAILIDKPLCSFTTQKQARMFVALPIANLFLSLNTRDALPYLYPLCHLHLITRLAPQNLHPSPPLHYSGIKVTSFGSELTDLLLISRCGLSLVRTGTPTWWGWLQSCSCPPFDHPARASEVALILSITKNGTRALICHHHQISITPSPWISSYKPRIEYLK